MMRPGRCRWAALALCLVVAAFVAAIPGSGVAAQERTVWRLQGTVPGRLPVIGTAGRFVSEQVSKVSGGAFEIRWYEPNALVPALESFDAVRAGSIDAAYGAAGYWAGKIPAAPLFSTHPFGPGPKEYIAWLERGGGQALWDEIYAAYGVKGIPCSSIGQEGSGWFKSEIETLEDLRGLKVRYAGYGGRVLQKLGASVQLLAAGEVAPALERGALDAAEFSLPIIDLELGLHRFARHYYFPGWHQPGTIGELLVNLGKWTVLSDTHRSQLRLVCKAAVLRSMVESESRQSDALAALAARGVIIHRWSPELLAAFRTAWHEVIAEEAAADADVKRVWDSIVDFRRRYARWRTLGLPD